MGLRPETSRIHSISNDGAVPKRNILTVSKRAKDLGAHAHHTIGLLRRPAQRVRQAAPKRT
jgi:hypothetical protein